MGGSKETFVNWEKGPRLSFPERDFVLIQPMGRGITKLLKGSWGRPEVSPRAGW